MPYRLSHDWDPFDGYGLANISPVRVLEGRGVAFVTYKNEANAQFAREAMAHQSLDHDEVLNVRWATPDPNPAAIRREARRVEEQAAEAIRRALPPEFVAEIEAKARGEISGRNKRQRIEGGSAGGNVGAGYDYGLEGYEVPDEVHFAVGPNAVNPIGRRGFEEEDEVPYEERMMMLEDSGARDGTTEQQPPPAAGGIFSSSTLAAISSAAAMNGSGSGSTQEAQKTKPQQTTRSGPLVAYGSDSEDDE